MKRAGVIAAAALASHLTALSAGYVWLDHAHLEGGAAIAKPAQWAGLFTHGFAGTGYYRPLMALSLSIDTLFGGATVHHAVNLAWHVGAAIATAFAAEALGLSRRAATLAAVLFAVHPLTALVGGAIAFRSEAMVAVALLVLVWAHLRAKPWIAGAAVLFGALTKEIAIPLAPLFVVALEWQRRRDGNTSPGAPPTRRLFALEGAGLIAALGLRLAYAPSWRASHEALSAGDAVGTRLAALAKSAFTIVLPIKRNICDAFPVTHAWQPGAIAGLVAAFAIVWIARRRRGPALLLALALLPSLQLVPVMRWWSPHYLYVPLAFVAMLAAEAAERIGERGAKIAFGVGAVLGALTLWDSRRYESDATLWGPEVTAQPSCREGQFYLGEVDRNAKRWDAAARRYDAALAPRPGVIAFVDRAAALQNLGVVQVERGRFSDARAAFRAALAGTSNLAARRELTHDLAAASLSDGDPAEAARLLEDETARPDALPASVLVRVLALRQLGRDDAAKQLLERFPAAR